jgi:hypothetical protein
LDNNKIKKAALNLKTCDNLLDILTPKDMRANICYAAVQIEYMLKKLQIPDLFLKNMFPADIVYPFIMTLGHNSQILYDSLQKTEEKFLLGKIFSSFLDDAMAIFKIFLESKFYTTSLIPLCPGSSANFPLEVQFHIFDFFKEESSIMELTLTESFSIFPIFSLSGYLGNWSELNDCSLCRDKLCYLNKSYCINNNFF